MSNKKVQRVDKNTLSIGTIIKCGIFFEMYKVVDLQINAAMLRIPWTTVLD